MITLKEFREQYPQYKEESDIDMTNFLHEKYYKNIPFDQFHKDFTGREDRKSVV